MLDARAWKGGLRQKPFKYGYGAEGFRKAVLRYTYKACFGWSDQIDAGRDEWDFTKQLKSEGHIELSPVETLAEMQRRFIEAHPDLAERHAEERKRTKKQRPVKMRIKRSTACDFWHTSYSVPSNTGYVRLSKNSIRYF